MSADTLTAGAQVILEWAPEQVFWDTEVDDIVVVPAAGEAPTTHIFVSQAGDLKQPVLIAFNAADSAQKLESYSDMHLVGLGFTVKG